MRLRNPYKLPDFTEEEKKCIRFIKSLNNKSEMVCKYSHLMHGKTFPNEEDKFFVKILNDDGSACYTEIPACFVQLSGLSKIQSCNSYLMFDEVINTKVIFRQHIPGFVSGVDPIVRVFDNEFDLIKFLVYLYKAGDLTESDIVLDDKIFCEYDSRWKWKNVKMVLFNKFGNEDYTKLYGHSMCFGYYSHEWEDKNGNKSRS